MKDWPKWIQIRYFDDNMREVGHTCSVTGSRDIIEIVDWLRLTPEKIIEFQVNQKALPAEAIDNFFLWAEKQRIQLGEKSA
ncbi:hypothetical protein GFC29_3848 (plasmid) [Anoxybacillus sp. B7M1]|uniref:hypothetical protein n=1 Tax=Anoxybacillus sp. B7M1 TaxID=1490057 RepID=UPI0005CDC20F|nr:hypothetical protein [Anoxybacillus sp. B7M1]ANB66104.1 hypothetical protein GFC29_3848 [Anoxybacillus sp. B7M1]